MSFLVATFFAHSRINERSHTPLPANTKTISQKSRSLLISHILSASHHNHNIMTIRSDFDDTFAPSVFLQFSCTMILTNASTTRLFGDLAHSVSSISLTAPMVNLPTGPMDSSIAAAAVASPDITVAGLGSFFSLMAYALSCENATA